MPLLGKAALLLSFDIDPAAIREHDDWHTHEHLRERLSIPGFIRGTRWVAWRGRPRYFVMYEVEQLATLTSDAYLDRLNNPSPWTSKTMPHYRDMTRGFCSLAGSFGFGLGCAALFIRFKPERRAESSLRDWLLLDALPRVPSRPGLGSVHLFEGALAPQMTNEQRIRGTDATVDWALLVTGYSEDELTSLEQAELCAGELEAHGATGVHCGMYRMEYTLTEREIDA